MQICQKFYPFFYLPFLCQEVYYPVQKSLEFLQEFTDSRDKDGEEDVETGKQIGEEIINFLENLNLKGKIDQDSDRIEYHFHKLENTFFQNQTPENKKVMTSLNQTLTKTIERLIDLPSSSRPDDILTILITKKKLIVSLAQNTKELDDWYQWFAEFIERNSRYSRLMKMLRKAQLISSENEIL